MSEQSAPGRSDAVAVLDLVIAEMERERVSARRQLANARGTSSEKLSWALKALDEKLEQARNTRAALVDRLERQERGLAIADELRAIRETFERLPATSENAARRADLRARVLELQAEVAALKQPKT